MLALAEFLDSLLRGTLLLGLSLALGGVAWGLAGLGGWWRPGPPAALTRCLWLVRAGAGALAVTQVGVLGLKLVVVVEALGPGAARELAATAYTRAGAARAVLAVALGVAAGLIGRAPTRRGPWLTAAALGLAVAVSGAWQTHAAGRLEYLLPLMALTVAHQTAAGVWVGGLAGLVSLWRLAARDAEVGALWPALVARFSRLALVSVLALVAASLPLVVAYAGSWQGLVGTGHGSLIVLKVGLLGCALALAGLNLLTVRGGATAPALRTRLPYLAEGEAVVAALIVFAAASLSAQPPAVDQASDQATVAEVAEVFRPKWPDLYTPAVTVMRQAGLRADAGQEPARSREAYLWSNFSHNVAGLILLGMSALALAGLAAGGSWGRHWPLGFAALAAFVYLRASANEGTWPFGATRLVDLDAEGIQHRIAALLVLLIGVVEWRARAGRRPGSRLGYLFPALGALGAVLLLTHSHTAFQVKSSFLVQITHSTMGALAAVLATARWLELRLSPPASRVAGAAAMLAMLLIALVLVFYREANLVISPD